jgi:YVTN family beta-propeller protein
MTGIVRKEIQRNYIYLKSFGTSLLVLLMLTGIAGADPFAYITNPESNVTIIDTVLNTDMVPLEAGLSKVAVSPDGSKVYRTDNGTNNISATDTVTNSTIASITAGNGPAGIAISPDGTRIFVTNSKDNTTSVINGADNSILATVDMGWEPAGIAVTPDGSTVYVASNDSTNVSVINATTNTITSALPVGTLESALVETAKNWVGVPNLHGGNNTSAIDCSHLVYQVYEQVGVKDIEFLTVPYMKNSTYYVNTTSPKPGDVIFWEKDITQNNRTYWLRTHVGIYIGNEQFIHTSYDTWKVDTDNITGVYKEGVPYYARWEVPENQVE